MYKERYEEWLNSDLIDEKAKLELKGIKDEKEIEDRFYKDLEFGTGGLRGVMAIGTNRMNIYTVRKATQGLSNYLINKYNEDISVCIGYDSRLNSETFAKEAALNLCANGIKVNLFESLRPTPMLSYAVRELKSKAGIVITASHNPKEYNGYKVYGEDGGQITDVPAKEIFKYIEAVDDLSKVKTIDIHEAKNKKLLNIIGEEVDKTYIDKVKKLCIRKELIRDMADKLKNNIYSTPWKRKYTCKKST
jgi:phosphoglucomutase